jgi:hypothetical protein
MLYKYYLGRCGFFSEVFNLINGLLWFGSNMILCNEHWIGTHTIGLQDYLDIDEFFKGKINSEEDEKNIIEIGRMTDIQFRRLVQARCMTHDINAFYNAKLAFTKIFWKPHAYVLDRVKQYEKELNIEGPYMSVHVRRGDNIDIYVPTEKYAEIINKISEIQNVYLMSDDDTIYEQLSKLCPSKRFYSFKKEMLGWIEGNFYDLPKEEKKRQIVDLICDVEIAKKSAVHIGSSSNVSRFIRFVHNNPNNYIQLDSHFDPF